MGGIGAASWGFAALALMLLAAAVAVVRARLHAPSALYAVMALCQAGNLVCMAFEANSAAQTWAPSSLNLPLRRGFDLATLAAAVHLSCIHPRRLQAASWLPVTAWLLALLTWLGAHTTAGDARGWWITQAALLVMGGVAVGVMHLSFRMSPHPFALVMKRFSLVVGGTWVLLQAAVIATLSSTGTTPLSHASLSLAMAIWQVLLALVLASLPFLSTTHSALRELSLFAIIGTLAIVLDLLLVSVFDLQRYAALAVALFLSIAVYTAGRQWLVNRMLGTPVARPEQLFEHLFRTTREVENHPEQVGPALTRLLQELFDPLEATLLDQAATSAHTLSDGSAMRVPVPVIESTSAPGAAMSILLRHAQQGRRLFTSDDARLAERVCEQLRRSVAFDLAVEQGRSEERRRLAQDLHDDIGARLLTLMYKAQSTEMEDYARHTLQDLKTLTRGLAASHQPLAHALAEWKADISHRLSAAHLALKWTATQDADVELSVVQWSALTRVLRELITNVIAHAQAHTVEIEVRLINDRLTLTVTDDGIGQAPEQWAPGLGVGGVRKRSRQLGGEVIWQERSPQGICCRVSVDRLSASG